MLKRFLPLLAAPLLAHHASAQIPGLPPIKADWSVFMESAQFDGRDGRFIILLDGAQYVIVDADTGKKIKFAKPVTENDLLRYGGGRVWVWTADEKRLCFDLATGREAPHQIPLSRHPTDFVQATPTSLIQLNAEETGMVSYSFDGKPGWKLDLQAVPGPILAEGDIIAVDAGTWIYLLSASGGKVLAQVPRPEGARLFKFGLLPDAAVFLLYPRANRSFGGSPATVIAADLKTGKTKWTKTIPWPEDWAKTPTSRFFSYSDLDTFPVIDGKAHIACGSNADGLRLITVSAADGAFSHQMLKAPGIRINSLVRAGPHLCGDATLTDESKACIVGLDPATLKPLWTSDAVYLRDGIWSSRDGVIVIGGYAMADEEKMAGFEAPGGVTAFSVPVPKSAAAGGK